MSDKLSWMCSVDDCERPKVGGLDVCMSHRMMEAKEKKAASAPVKKAVPLKRSYVKPMSEKRKVESKEYNKLKDEYLRAHPDCEANLRNCTGDAVEVHHKAKRGKNYLNVETFMSTCRECHIIIEQVMSAEERREQGFLIDVNEKPII